MQSFHVCTLPSFSLTEGEETDPVYKRVTAPIHHLQILRGLVRWYRSKKTTQRRLAIYRRVDTGAGMAPSPQRPVINGELSPLTARTPAVRELREQRELG
jgi:hypothetical protein